jgi:hypothetical protein
MGGAERANLTSSTGVAPTNVGNVAGMGPQSYTRDFQNIDMPVLRGDVHASFDSGLYFGGAYSHSWPASGTEQDTGVIQVQNPPPAGALPGIPVVSGNPTFTTNNFFGGSSNIKGASIWNGNATLGYEFKIYEPNAQGYFHMIPLVGYSESQQNITTVQRTPGVSTAFTPSYPSTGSFKTDWSGPFLGGRMLFEFPSNLLGFAQFEYHFDDYTGKTTWNSTFPVGQGTPISGVAQNGDANGWVVNFGFDYAPHLVELEKFGNFYMRLNFEYRDFWVNQGTEITSATGVLTPMGGGSVLTQSIQPINHLEYESFGATVGLGLRF